MRRGDKSHPTLIGGIVMLRATHAQLGYSRIHDEPLVTSLARVDVPSAMASPDASCEVKVRSTVELTG